MLRCACRLTHLAASKAADMLHVKVDELLVDICYYLDILDIWILLDIFKLCSMLRHTRS